ncbi:hypothetical protein SDC9_78947 [bioreactor metagenome]|uniref:Uncharacterized protein n=1 Tax=bioreactor metagenome TaxID=1076179 RepID=A0A644YUW5_9ZZZZ
MPQMTGFILMFDFNIRQRGITVYAPVGNPAALVNKSFLIKRNKYFTYCFRTTFIHSKAFALPIAGNTEAFQLVDDMVAVLFFPRPDAFQKFLAS